MKRTLSLLLALLAPAVLFAGSLDYLTNQSARWLFSLSRNASTDAADIVNYNPAGTVFLPKGLNLDLSNQTLFKFYKNADSTFAPGVAGTPIFSADPVKDTLEPDVLTPALPNLYGAYNFGDIGPGKLAIYLQAGIPAGGGDLSWGDGTAGSTFALNGLRAQLAGAYADSNGAQGALTGALSSQEFNASSIYYGVGLGGAYSFLGDLLSLSLGARLVIPQRSFSLSASYGPGYNLSGEYEYSALGITPIVGFDLRPIEGLTIGLRYEMETNLEFEYKQKSLSGSLKGAGASLLASSGIADGKKFNQNLPHIISIGAEYEVSNLTISLSGNIYLLSLADLGETYVLGVKDGEINDYFDTGWELALGASYKITEAIKLGLGVMYTESGAKDSYFNDSHTLLNASANPPLDSVSCGLGGSYAFKNGLDLVLSCLYSHYLPADYSVSQQSSGGYEVYNVSGTLNKDVLEVGIGIGYKF